MKSIDSEYASRPRKYTINHYFFDKSNESEEQFYWAGWIASTGNVVQLSSGEKSYRIEFNISVQDKEHLQKLLTALSSDAQIKIANIKIKDRIYQQARVVIHSKYLVNDLRRFSLGKGKKSNFYMPEWLISHFLLRHFIRGWVDGKGNFYPIHLDNEYCKEFRTSGPEKYLNQLSTIFSKITCEEHPLFTNNNSKMTYHVTNSIMKIAHYLYDNVHVCLERKKPIKTN